MNKTMNFLTVPMRVDALVADFPMNAVKTSDDFDDLPYLSQDNIDVNYDTANLASSIANTSFNNLCTLPPGIHLHWSLPDALTKGEVTDEGLKMPKVPNRWLILRNLKTDTDPELVDNELLANKSWIIESDYIHSEDAQSVRAICIPSLDKGEGKQKPYHYLGRQIELNQWLSETEEQKAKASYLPELNVLGWGTPYFSSLYTDCFSVFGAFDEGMTSEQVANYEYQVFGWYSDETQDYVQDSLINGETSLDTFISDAKQTANWQVEGDVIAQRLLCYGKVSFADELNLRDSFNEKETRFNFSKSPMEAVARHLAQRFVAEHVESTSDEDEKEEVEKLENQLLSVLINEDVQGQSIDFVDSLKSSRHEQEFAAVSSGYLWKLKSDEAIFKEAVIDLDSDNESELQSLKLKLNQFKIKVKIRLSELNRLQELANQNKHTLQFFRRLLYSDWTKYMLSLHPTDLQSDSYPDFNQIAFMMRTDTIAKLKEHEDLQSSLMSSIEAEICGIMASYRGELDLSESEVERFASPLIQVPGPRYWKPKDPTLLLSGEVVNPSRRHGKDGVLKCQVVSCEMLTNEMDRSMTQWLQNMDTQQPWQWAAHSLNQWQQQPWSPLFMEWRVAGFPDERARTDKEGENYQYDQDYVTTQYRIPLNDDHYSLPSAAVDLTKDREQEHLVTESPNTVNGRSLLTFSFKKVVLEKLKKYKDELEDQAINEDVDEFNHRLETIYEQYDAEPIMMQTLDGLHDELIMYSNLTLLKLFDPSQFAHTDGFDKDISDEVNALLGNKKFKLPSTGHRFTPIKNGDLQIEQLRVVDTFGRYKNIINPHRLPENSRINSMPRVLSPLRLSFRWLDLIDEDTQAVSPISGWIGYNLFDETVMIYDSQGYFVGAINSDGEWVDDHGDKQALNVVNNAKLRSLILKLLSFHNDNRISKAQFIDQSHVTEELWQNFIELNLIVPYKQGTKAYRLPITREMWPAEAGVEYEEALSLFSASRSSTNYWPKLKQAIRRGQDNVEPLGSENNMYCPFQPLAIVSANLDLQLMGKADVDKSWAALNEYLETGKRRNRQFTKVKWPIKLGEYNNIDDGLIGYWTVAEGVLSETGYFPQSDMRDVHGETDESLVDAANFDPNEHDYVDQIRGEGVLNLTRSLDDEPLELLMLMDVQSKVHATTGIVPRKLLRLDPEDYINALKNIQADYFAAPLLSPTETFSIPLASQITWEWQQTLPQGERLQKFSGRLVNKATFIDRIINSQNGGENTHIIVGSVAMNPEELWQWMIQHEVLAIIPSAPNLGLLNAVDVSLWSKEWQQVWGQLDPIVQASCEQQIAPLSSVGVLASKLKAVEGRLKPAMDN
ncbi:hypothetical protein BS333_15230 [Vibrio azureus]|uniref:Uncharacterized protein n=1 Tax=Vibrio azureus NBRC 104587 TaxID=1219077 RepID=U3AS46_9VIBR|nr:hypothetical protein [Vibrio azureus]AUI87753.1 hypothetical protein BS333_15230 [Vibrio azureus]GAD76585.1 hypothetical protein VAZ01S_047_00100 [Vibrio azureus NBRC 104587]